MKPFTENEKKLIHSLWRQVLVKFNLSETFTKQMWRAVEYQIDIARQNHDDPCLAVLDYLNNALRYQRLDF